jgi:mevalonate pyrophosphate decarboxylase
MNKDMTNYAETAQEHKKTRPPHLEFRALYPRVKDVPRHPTGHEVAITGTHSYRARRWVKESKPGLSRMLRAQRRADFEAIQWEEETA